MLGDLHDTPPALVTHMIASVNVNVTATGSVIAEETMKEGAAADARNIEIVHGTLSASAAAEAKAEQILRAKNDMNLEKRPVEPAAYVRRLADGIVGNGMTDRKLQSKRDD